MTILTTNDINALDPGIPEQGEIITTGIIKSGGIPMKDEQKEVSFERKKGEVITTENIEKILAKRKEELGEVKETNIDMTKLEKAREAKKKISL